MQQYRMILHILDKEQTVDDQLCVKEWKSDWVESTAPEQELTVLKQVFESLQKSKGQ